MLHITNDSQHTNHRINWRLPTGQREIERGRGEETGQAKGGNAINHRVYTGLVYFLHDQLEQGWQGIIGSRHSISHLNIHIRLEINHMNIRMSCDDDIRIRYTMVYYAAIANLFLKLSGTNMFHQEWRFSRGKYSPWLGSTISSSSSSSLVE